MSGRARISGDHQTASANIFQVNMMDVELILISSMEWSPAVYIVSTHIYWHNPDYLCASFILDSVSMSTIPPI